MDPDEWEYEYHDTETETFYLNLDLSSHHGPIRPPRRRQGDPSNEPANAADDAPDANSGADTLYPLESAESETVGAERIQILGLHTCNPIVSYHNQIFSCSWADQIGTELVFAHPDSDPDPDHTPLYHGPSFDLLAANSVKILGRKANITSSSGLGLVQQGISGISDSAPETPSSSQTVASTSVPRRVVPQTYQAQFLQQLQNIKTANGERDTVRTTMSNRRNVNLAERLSGWARTEEQVAEVNRLRALAYEGDPEALATLEQLIREHVHPDE
ncbi:uncharacterized protein N7477_005552 [Penicillium maclennaniae]|uniref:uncharacterized protein n=1 Tax=Penicillium maclennaniae TaxID=1343394 RepID=UPI002541529E|nr:uncharacterized protein N7477_005552 [Penicillium maclennaniae]KAJ5670189.1 hypothetical protein N7477_005552 [Penicillium maclennaniae]